MLKTRVITAAALLAVLLAALAVSENLLLAVLAVGFGAVVWEWLRIARIEMTFVWMIAGIETAVMCAAAFLDVRPGGELFIGFELIVTCVWLAVLAVVFAARDRGFGLKRSYSIVMALTFPLAAWAALLWFAREGGWPLMLSVFMVVWLADVFAYFSGLAFGRHKMAVAISPKKTWEGALGAVVTVLFVTVVAYVMLPVKCVFTSRLVAVHGFGTAFVMIFLLVALSIAGDLFESALKRQAGIKDSSNLLPGHGGFFDRLDAALAVFPAAAVALLVL
jgi:phosphatidate cytidylyltransferase